MKKSILIYAAAFLLLFCFWTSESFASRAHAALDKFYDQMADEPETEIEPVDNSATPSEPIQESLEPTSTSIALPIATNFFNNLNEFIIIQILKFIDNPIDFGLSCKLFWRIVSSLLSYRILGQPLVIHNEGFDVNLVPGSDLTIPAALRAFGSGDSRVKTDLLAKNLELAFHSPAFREAFDENIWSKIAKDPAFNELTEKILMESLNPPQNQQAISPEIEAHRRILISILASLPEDVNLVTEFFTKYPVTLLNPISTEVCFDKFIIPIAKRLALLPETFLIDSVLKYFNFDSRLIDELIKLFIKRAQHAQIRALFDAPFAADSRTYGQTYIGCVVVQQFVKAVELYLNSFDEDMREIFNQIVRTVPNHTSDFINALLELNDPHPLNRGQIFHVAVLKSYQHALASFEDFDFSYGKDDSEFMNHLIERDPNMVISLLNRFPLMASHKSLLLSSQFQSVHFGSFSNLRTARIELKRTISCPEITRAHIHYIQDYQERLYRLLLADSSDRISSYFTMNLKGYERKRYKEHPSFNIALTTLDVYYESRLARCAHKPELCDPEMILKNMFIDLNLIRERPEEYFELAHGLPSFSKALRAGGIDEEDSLLVPEGASTQNDAEFELLSHTIALNRVIHDGKALNYRLVLKWFDDFGTGIVNIIPIHELKALLKGAAFHTIRSPDDKKLRFDLDAQLQNDPFSMTYRYAVIIIATQCKGVPASVVKRLKSLFPGVLSEENHLNANEQNVLIQLVAQACEFYRLHATDFFSKFKIVATNSRAERFIIDFIRHFINISGLVREHPTVIVGEFFRFINLDPEEEILLREHFIYFVLLASFRKRI